MIDTETVAPPSIVLVPIGKLLDAQPNDWLIEGVLENNSMAQIFGEPASAKSLLALDWAACVATGIPWRGRTVMQGNVLYIAGEGAAGIPRRLNAWEFLNGRSLREAPLEFITSPVALTDPQSRDGLLRVIRQMGKAGRWPELIIIDTVARNFGTGDENSTKDMTAFVASCDALREENCSTVLTLHHSGHGDKQRSRGSTALKAALDWEYSIVKDGSSVQLTCVKSKDASPPAPMGFSIAVVELGQDYNGATVTGAALADSGLVLPNRHKRGGKNQGIALRALAKLTQSAQRSDDTGSGVAPSGFASREAWARACSDEGITGKRFSEVALSLTRSGMVVQTGNGFSLGADRNPRDALA